MKVLLIGGTGVISRDVCRLSLEKNYEVYTINRGRRKTEASASTHTIIADIRNDSTESIKDKVGNITFDVVVDFLSYTVGQLKKTIACVNCRQYIFISSSSVYETQGDDHVYKESDKKGNRGWKYCADKYDCELALPDFAKSHGMTYTIIRPYITYNNTRFPYQISPVQYNTIVSRIRRGRPIPICDDVETTVTDSRDFAVGVVGLFMNPMAESEDFHITSGNTVKWSRIAELMADAFETEPHFVHISKEEISGFTNSVIDIDEILLDKNRYMRFDNSKIRAAVPDFNPQRAIEISIREICEYYKNESRPIDYLWAGCLDRLMKRYGKDDNVEYVFEGSKSKLMYRIGRSYILCSAYLLARKIGHAVRGL